jgi:hypothetical protein
MNITSRVSITVTAALVAGAFVATALPTPTAESRNGISGEEIIEKVLDVDSFGLSGADVTARIIIRDTKRNKKRKLAFNARSIRHAPPLAKSLVRFDAPSDIAGMGFLQIQNEDADDDRYLYLPELKKTRRIAGKLRSQSFMGTDFTYADIDRRDIRYSRAKFIDEEQIGEFDTYVVMVKPSKSDRQYKKIKLWVRQDNFVTLKSEMFNKSGTKLKTRLTREMKKVDGRWYITRSVMLDHKRKRSTEMILDRVDSSKRIRKSEFTVRHLEKF